MDALQAEAPLKELIISSGLIDVMGGQAAFEQGWLQIQNEMLRVGMDALTAENKGESLSRAVLSFENYPLLARLHALVDDMLTWTLPVELRRWTENFLASANPTLLEHVTSQLIEYARYDENIIRRASWRVMLFEAIRINLKVLYISTPATAAAGISSEDLSFIAEERMRQWLKRPPPIPEGGRPFAMLVAAAVAGIEQYGEELAATLGHLQADFVEEMRCRAILDRALAQLDLRDALLIKNVMADRFEERTLTVEQLQHQHPLAFEGMKRAAIDQRLHRARKSLKTGEKQTLQRHGVALIDIVINPRSPSKRI